MRCLFTATAEADLEQIADYIAADNPVRAISFVQEIRDRCARIVHAPRGGRLVPTLGINVRKLVFGSYLVFYEVSGVDVIILHVLHGARNVEALLEERRAVDADTLPKG